jgi:23S rRNA pseudouridine1911/1915/1917 synthase
MALLETHIIPTTVKSQYLTVYAPTVFKYLTSKAKTKQAILSGHLKVNGNKVGESQIINPNDILDLTAVVQVINKTKKTKGFDLEVEVCYEDEHIAAVNKPSGLQVMGNQLKTLENCLPYNITPSAEKDALEFPVPVHRLDEPTSGIVLIAKTHRAQVILGKMFQEKKIHKRYKALIIGKLVGMADINVPIERQPAHTQYKAVKNCPSFLYDAVSIVELFPVTGRTHQLRIHMSELGHPIIGDKFYTKGHKLYDEKGLFLCSDLVSFEHPFTKKSIKIEIKIPSKFSRFLEREATGAKKLARTNDRSPDRKRNR